MIIPAPVSVQAGPGVFRLGPGTRIVAADGADGVAEYLGALLRPATGLELGVVASGASETGDVELVIEGGHAPDGYSLAVTPDRIRMTASDSAGLFYAVQSLRQLLPPEIESRAPVAATWPIPAATITDHPRFPYRGAMLDVARHFFSVDEVKRYIDDIAMLKLNVLHLHLTDDQGWRIQIHSWPKLTEVGAATQVGGGGGGFYTQQEYRDLVAYAATRFIVIVPEIDLPGHTNAALAAYPELNCDGIAPPPYEGIQVGFSSLCIGNERTYDFVADVVRELAALTPGPWLHIGGDESLSTTDADFLTFVRRAAAIVADAGKTPVGWHEMGRSSDLPRGTIGQYWSFTTPGGDAAANAASFVAQGGKLIMSPADVAYLDMKYDDNAALGLVWADGPTPVAESYNWDPAAIVPGIGEDGILGVEAPIWGETLRSLADLEFMAFPRVAALAEIGWSPGTRTDFIDRLRSFTNRLQAAGIAHNADF